MPSLQITAAVPTDLFSSGGNGTADMRPFVPYFDRVYLMLYDLWKGDQTAGSNAPLDQDVPDTSPAQAEADTENAGDDYPYSNAGADPNQDYCISGVETWKDAGFPLEKLIFGLSKPLVCELSKG